MGRTSFSVLLVLAAAGLAYSQFPERCHTQILVPHHFLNLEKFLGVWYPLKVAPSKASQSRPLNYTCLTANFTQSPVNNVLNVVETYLQLDNGTVISPVRDESIAIIGEINPARPLPSIMSVYNTPQGSNETVNTQVVILAADEDSWAIQYSCGLLDGELLERISIWSRQRTLDPVVYDVLDNIVYGIGFPLTFFKEIGQENCDV
jgi:hypothetical protein